MPYLKFQIPNLKSQIISESHIPITAPHPSPSPRGGEGGGEGVLNFVHWELFGIWCLGFGAYAG